MKLSKLHAAALLAAAVALSACGGKQSFDVSGTISGLSDSDLVLTNNGDTVKPALNATSFTFPNRIDYGTAYNIVANQPLHLDCSVTGGSGSAGHFTSISATVTCARKRHALSGTVTGLKLGTLQLANGSAGSLTLTGTDKDLSFTFGTIADGAAYSIGVLPPQPAGQTCTVSANGTGVMGTSEVVDVKVTCI